MHPADQARLRTELIPAALEVFDCEACKTHVLTKLKLSTWFKRRRGLEKQEGDETRDETRRLEHQISASFDCALLSAVISLQ